jgi:hypothetical protein
MAQHLDDIFNHDDSPTAVMHSMLCNEHVPVNRGFEQGLQVAHSEWLDERLYCDRFGPNGPGARAAEWGQERTVRTAA